MHNSSFNSDKGSRKSAIDKKPNRKEFLVRKKSQTILKRNNPDDAGLVLFSSPNDELTPSNDLENTALLMPAPEEPPYFLEKYPGKVCGLCNLGERSQLGQGEMIRLEMSDKEETDPFALASPTLDDSKNSSGSSVDSIKTPKSSPQFSNKRQKGLNKCKNPVNATEYVDELDKIGYTESIEFGMLNDGGFFYVHQACAMWSFGVQKESNNSLKNVPLVVQQSLARQCTYCNRYGASIACKVSITNTFTAHMLHNNLFF